MPAGNPVINTASSFPSRAIDVGRGATLSTPGTLVADRRAHEEDTGGADQRTTACDSEAQTRATARAPGSAGTQASPVHDHRIRRGRRRRRSPRWSACRRHQATTRTARPPRPPPPHRRSAAPTQPARRRRPAAPVRRARRTSAPNCQYPASRRPASKPINPPRTGKVPTDPAQISASMTTDQGNIGLQLDNAKAPCTVNSFASLAQQGFFNDTPCHRLTTSRGLSVLQCGDPTGQGTGGPGYEFANEYPTNQFQPDDPAAAAAGDVSARHAGDGQRRARHQRQPVLPGLQGLAAAAELHGVRHDRRDRAGHAGQDRRGRRRRRRRRTASRRPTSRSSRSSWTDPA